MIFMTASLVASLIDKLADAKKHSASTDNIMKALRDDGYSEEWIAFQVKYSFQKRHGNTNETPVVLTERRKEPEAKPCVKPEEHKEVKKQSDIGFFSCHNEYNGPMRDIRYSW